MSLPSSPRYGFKPIWVTLHAAEGARTVGSLFNFFDSNQNASSHAGADGYQLSGDWVPDERAAWTLLNGNPRSLNLEMCGFSHWTRAQWLSDGWVEGVWNPRQMIRNAATWARRKCDKHGIPRRLLTPAEVGRGVSGIIDHARYTYGTGDGDHTDVGANFPWDVFFGDLNNVNGIEDDDVLSEQQDRWVRDTSNHVDEIHAVLISGVKRDAKLNEDLGFVIKVLSDKFDAVVADIDEEALAAAMDARGMGGVSASGVKDALREVLTTTRLTPGITTQ